MDDIEDTMSSEVLTNFVKDLSHYEFESEFVFICDEDKQPVYAYSVVQFEGKGANHPANCNGQVEGKSLGCHDTKRHDQFCILIWTGSWPLRKNFKRDSGG